jgi:tricorn protease
MISGYYRFPTIHEDTIVFVSEDDLWSVPRTGGVPRRLTSNLGEVNYPALSPDGAWLAFVGREEGVPEVFLMPALGGSARRLTFLNHPCQVLGWTPDGQSILFASTYGQFHPQEYAIFRVAAAARNGAVEPVAVGPARSIAFGPAGQVVIGRNTGDPARWKRYRGGTAGHLWIDRQGDGQFTRFLGDLRGNIAAPMWLETATGPRIFFISDHEGVGNLYSSSPAGADVRRHTDHEDFYARNPSSDGRRIVYHAGADLYVYDPALEMSTRIDVDYRSPRVQRNRKFAPALAYLDSARLSPRGTGLAVTTRGKAFAFYNHEGPVLQLGQRDGVRHRLADLLNDGLHVVMVDDAAGEEELVVYSLDIDEEPRRLAGLDIGRPVQLKVSPTEDKVALSNHRQELLVVDLKTAEVQPVDRSDWHAIVGFDWAPDGRWLAYGFATSLRTSEIRLFRLPATEKAAGEAPPHTAEPDAEAEAAKTQEPAPASFPNPVAVTRPVLHDVMPAFDPDGKYLYFLSYREFNPVYDNLQFDLGFPWGMRPYLVTLRADLPNPFIPRPAAQEEDEEEDEREEDEAHDETAGDEEAGASGGDDEEAEEEGADGDEEGEDEGAEEDEEPDDDETDDYPLRRKQTLAAGQQAGANIPAEPAPADDAGRSTGAQERKGEARAKGDRPADSGKKGESRPRDLVINLAGIEQRVLAFPVSDSRYGQIAGVPGRALFTSFPVVGTLDDHHDEDDEESDQGTLRAWVFKDYKAEMVADRVSSFQVARNGKKLLYFSGRRLRVIAAGEKAPGDSGPGRKSGWVDLTRIKVSVDPQREWEQMVREAWRLQRDHFWTEDMSAVDWRAVYERYAPLVERVSTRSEFSDLVWEMQGELGTSHAYEFGGDYRSSPYFTQGVLGADFTWDAEAGGYRIGHIVVGDSWHAEHTSPLVGPGTDVRTGDLLIAINGQRLGAEVSPAQLLVNQAGQEVLLTFAPRPQPDADPTPQPEATGEEADQPAVTKPRSVVVRALHDDDEARYRAWVEANRRQVHAATGGRIGYLHIPDMGPRGYAEFHRGFLAELARDGLIVDVRYNRGGHVSQLLLEKLARRRIGYDKSRWSGLAPYPYEAVGGPIVALTNELAGSDGDIFCHSFKLLKLGPLVGKRTWGGVIGISPRHPLVDGTITTQPEYSSWFEDVGWEVENYGTDPDVEVDNTPQDYLAGRDAQLERAIAEAQRLLAEQRIVQPDPATRPSRALPRLPQK